VCPIFTMHKRTVSVLIGCILALPASGYAARVANRKFETSDRVHLHYLEAGRGPTLVFIPGWMMPAEIWRKQIDYFSARFHVVALDPRSQGRSDKVASGHYPERLARDIKELLDHLGVIRPVLVGWSLATRELLSYVDTYGTDSVSGLVFVDGYIDRTEPTKEWLHEFQSNRVKVTAEFVRSMYRREQPEAYYDTITAAAMETPTDVAALLLINMSGNWWSVAEKLNCPLLYVVSGDAKEQAERLKTKVPSVVVRIFADAGHALFVDESARFNALLEEFVHNLQVTHNARKKSSESLRSKGQRADVQEESSPPQRSMRTFEITNTY
jgi:non-heme chloroperoxidase